MRGIAAVVPAWAVPAGLLLLLSACSAGSPPPAPPPSESAVPVTVGSVVEKSVPVDIQGIGTVEALSTVTVKAQVEGELTSIHLTEGQEVRKGELLFEIDPRAFEARLRQAQADQAKDRAELDNARLQVRRLRKLVDQGVVSNDQFDQARASAAALAAAVLADEAAVETAKLELQYTTIRSPLSGRTGALLVHPGNLVKANDTALVVIHRITPSVRLGSRDPGLSPEPAPDPHWWAAHEEPVPVHFAEPGHHAALRRGPRAREPSPRAADAPGRDE